MIIKTLKNNIEDILNYMQLFKRLLRLNNIEQIERKIDR
jgi:hypothetical protein